MKNFFLTIFFFFILSIQSKAEIAFIDVNYILNTSDVGKSLNSHIKKINDKNIKKNKNIEDQLIKKEKSLISQKNILDENEFQKKLNILSLEITKYREDKKLSQTKINQIKIEKTKEILNLLNPIITKYVQENSISLVIPKKNIIVGKKKLDITNKIIKILNQKKIIINF